MLAAEKQNWPPFAPLLPLRTPLLQYLVYVSYQRALFQNHIRSSIVYVSCKKTTTLFQNHLWFMYILSRTFRFRTIYGESAGSEKILQIHVVYFRTEGVVQCCGLN